MGRCFATMVLVQFVDVELHPIEFLEQVVRELDIRLVDLVDQEHEPILGLERFPEFALLDVVPDIPDTIVAELRVAQARHGVVFVETLQSLGLGLDMPSDQAQVQGLGDLLGEQGLAGAGLALDQERSLELHRGIHGHG